MQCCVVLPTEKTESRWCCGRRRSKKKDARSAAPSSLTECRGRMQGASKKAECTNRQLRAQQKQRTVCGFVCAGDKRGGEWQNLCLHPSPPWLMITRVGGMRPKAAIRGIYQRQRGVAAKAVPMLAQRRWPPVAFPTRWGLWHDLALACGWWWWSTRALFLVSLLLCVCACECNQINQCCVGGGGDKVRTRALSRVESRESQRERVKFSFVCACACACACKWPSGQHVLQKRR